MARPHEDGMWTPSARLRAAHCRVDAVLSRVVVRGCDDAAPVGITAHDQRNAGELGPLELLHGCEERVEIEVCDDLRAACHG
jgi:hypothetical protein